MSGQLFSSVLRRVLPRSWRPLMGFSDGRHSGDVQGMRWFVRQAVRANVFFVAGGLSQIRTGIVPRPLTAAGVFLVPVQPDGSGLAVEGRGFLRLHHRDDVRGFSDFSSVRFSSSSPNRSLVTLPKFQP